MIKHKVVPFPFDDLSSTKVRLDQYEGLMARDALHAAVARIHGAQAICSYDGDFDEIAGLRRIEPSASGSQKKLG